jgi:opacity protein-like surface antigen
VTGFYSGAQIGPNFISNKFKKNAVAKDAVKRSKTGFVADAFGGYNFQFDRVMFGLECSVKVSPAKTETEVELNSVKKNVSARRRYSFGVSSRVGYNVCGGLIVYVKLGTDVTKFNLRSQKGDDKTTETKKNPRKMVMQASAGAEQSFGPWFVRGECGKSIGKGVGEIDGVNVTSGHWTGLVGAGYRF